MKQSILIAWRNISRQRKRSFLLGGAIGFAFLVITLVGGFTAGLAVNARNNFSNALGGHIYFSGSQVSALGSEISLIADPSALEATLKQYQGQIAAVHRRSSSTGTLIFGTTELRQKIVGVDFQAEKDFKSGMQLASGSLDRLGEPGALVLPQDVATKLGLKVGETAMFKSGTVSGQQNVNELVLVATTAGQSSQTPMGGGTGYASLATVNSQLGLRPGEFQTVNVWLKKMDDIDAVADQMFTTLSSYAPVYQRASATGDNPMKNMMRMMGGSGTQAIAQGEAWAGTKYRMTTLNELMASFMTLISTVDQVGFWIFVILLVITMVGIMNSYRMVMMERIGEIGTMRAIGVQRGGIRDIFLFESLFLALGGALAGFSLALLLMGLASLPAFGGQDMLSFFLNHGHMSFRVSALESLKNTLVLCLLSLAAVYLPARTASRLDPAVALRSVY